MIEQKIAYIRKQLDIVEEKYSLVAKYGKQQPMKDARRILKDVREKVAEIQRDLLTFKKRE